LDAGNVKTGIARVGSIAKYRAMYDLAKDFACRVSSNFLNRHVTPHRYELTHRSYANRSVHARALARTSRVQLQHSGHGSQPVRNDYWTAHRASADRSDVEGLYQSRPTRLGQHHPDL